MADLSPGTFKIYSDTTVASKQGGEAIAVGDAVYLSGGKYYVCDATDSGKATIAGIAATSCALDGYFVLASAGSIDIGATLTVGAIVRISATGITHDATASGSYVSELGYAATAAKLVLDIRNTATVAP